MTLDKDVSDILNLCSDNSRKPFIYSKNLFYHTPDPKNRELYELY